MIPWRIRQLVRGLLPDGAAGWLSGNGWTLEQLGLAKAPMEAATTILADLLTEVEATEQSLPGAREAGTVVLMDTDPEIVRWLSAAVPDLDLVSARTEAEALPHLRNAIALVGWCTSAMLRAAPQLRWVQGNTSGIEDLSRLTDNLPPGVRVTSMRGVAAPTIAEHAMALLLCLSRRLDLADRPQTRWMRRRALEAGGIRPVSLAGSRALIVGFGHVGRHIASLTTAFGIETWGIRSRPGITARGLAGSLTLDDLDKELHRFPVVFNALPLTARTAGVFDRSLFERMPAGSFFINVGRGGTVKTDDLVAVLRDGPLSGAGLDVTEPEPLPLLHPLLRAPNALVTQHRAGQSPQTKRRELLVLRENLRRFQDGAPLLCKADPHAGY